MIQATLERFLQSSRPKVVVDAGMNLGLFTRFAWEVFESSTSLTCLAFEPAPDVFQMAVRGCEESGMPVSVHLTPPTEALQVGEVHCFQLALSETSSVQRFTHFPESPANSALTQHSPEARWPAGQVPESVELEVTCCRLSDILGDLQGAEIFLKVDVEGAEVDLLRGIDDQHWDAISAIAMEVSGKCLADVLQLCKDHNLEVENFQQPSADTQDLEELFMDHLLLPSPYHPADFSRSLPSGLKLLIGFGLCALKCCGEDHFQGTQELKRWQDLSKVLSAEDLALEATELVFTMKVVLQKWPEEKDKDFFACFTSILSELAEDADEFQSLWDDVRSRKQAIADCAGNCDEQLMTLAQRTHFSVDEIERLRKEVLDLRRNPRQPAKVDLDSFKKLVKRTVPEFPTDLCGRLFQKLDCFSVGRLSFVELACGMSALSLGTMDEKLQVCFDMFDSEGRRALSLSDVNDLCSTLFRVALSTGIGSKQASYDEAGAVINVMSRRSVGEAEDMVANASTFSDPSSFLPCPPGTPPARRLKIHVKENPSNEDPSRSMLLRLLAAAKVRTPGGPWLVAFEDFCNAARMEPALLCLFSWCLPRPPQSTPVFMFESTTSQSETRGFVSRWCHKICNWLGRNSSR
eukprot:symbB.v1.2.017936.t1/scaffold1406.1/size338231/15